MSYDNFKAKEPRSLISFIKICVCYLYWWFLRKQSKKSDFGTNAGIIFAKMQFYNALLWPLLLAVVWGESKFIKLDYNVSTFHSVIASIGLVWVTESFVLNHAPTQIADFEKIKHRFKPELAVTLYLIFVLAVVTISIIYNLTKH